MRIVRDSGFAGFAGFLSIINLTKSYATIFKVKKKPCKPCKPCSTDPLCVAEVKSCIYSRVSTSEQDTQNQTMVLTDWAKQRGFEIAKVYEEEELAWKTGHQRALAQLLNDARRGKFTVVLVWSRPNGANASQPVSSQTRRAKMTNHLLGPREKFRWPPPPLEAAQLKPAGCGCGM